MTDRSGFGFLICLFLIIGVFFAGCSDSSSDAVVTASPTPAPVAQFTAGDIIAKTSSGGETQLYVIRKYDSATDEYERAWIYKNADGSWGHFIDGRTELVARKIAEKVYPVKVAHVTLSSIPITALTVATVAPTVVSGDAPTVTAISPTSGAASSAVTVSISGTNFQTGATAKLLQPGYPAVTATGVIVSSTKVDGTFNLNGKETGKYNVIVSNPDGQSGMLSSGFTIGDAGPIISYVTPATMEMNTSGGLVISGENFKDGVKVTLLKGTAEIPCTSPAVTAGTRLSCDIDLSTRKNSAITFGNWDVKVLNIEGSMSGTWTKKFAITNDTSLSTEDD